MAENENKRFGFLRSLFEKKNAEEESDVKIEISEEQRPSEDEEKKAARAEAASIRVGEGSLLELWRRWSGGHVPLTISLLGDGCGCEVVLTDREMVAERLRLTAKIERDAKDFLRAMDRYEESKLRINARRAMLESKKAQDEQSEQDETPKAQEKEEVLEEVKTFCRIYTSANNMAAWMLLLPPSDPNDLLDRTTINEILSESEISRGLSTDAIDHIENNHPYFMLIPIACGIPVTEGEHGRVVEHYSRQRTRSVKVDDNGVADYRALNYVQIVNEGDVICDILPPKPGKAGVRIDGMVAEPPPVKAAVAPAGKNTKVTKDGSQLVAEKTGHLEYDGKNFYVKILLDIPGNVDYSTGNLEYNGDIHIHGDVRNTFSVKASGNIIVDGLVEAAQIEAGGDVLVSCGIMGDGNARIVCGGDLRAKYLESCEVYVGKSIFADCVMSSQVHCDDTLQITSGRGAIIGGSAVVGKAIKANITGTDSGRKTELELGAQTYIKMKHSEEIEELKHAMGELTKLDRDIAFLENKLKLQEKQSNEGADEVFEQRLEAAVLQKTAICARIDELTKVQKEIEDKKPDLEKCRFECGTVYPPTMLLIGGAIWKFEETKHNCAAWLDKTVGEINIT